jgi:hypothetical protein
MIRKMLSFGPDRLTRASIPPRGEQGVEAFGEKVHDVGNGQAEMERDLLRPVFDAIPQTEPQLGGESRSGRQRFQARDLSFFQRLERGPGIGGIVDGGIAFARERDGILPQLLLLFDFDGLDQATDDAARGERGESEAALRLVMVGGEDESDLGFAEEVDIREVTVAGEAVGLGAGDVDVFGGETVRMGDGHGKFLFLRYEIRSKSRITIRKMIRSKSKIRIMKDSRI